MTDSPRALSLHRKLARKLPRPVRRAFVQTVDHRLKKTGKHHLGVPRCAMTIPEARALTDLAEDLETGAREWREWNPDLTCADRQEVAAAEAAEAARQAWEQLGVTARGTR